tara:strand:+ start:96 stop:221 length:126 start_codon:yes stop_codon:yes gene_type:complete
MTLYRITTENGEYQETYTGLELYMQVLNKFKIKYKVEIVKK